MLPDSEVDILRDVLQFLGYHPDNLLQNEGLSLHGIVLQCDGLIVNCSPFIILIWPSILMEISLLLWAACCNLPWFCVLLAAYPVLAFYNSKAGFLGLWPLSLLCLGRSEDHHCSASDASEV